MENYYLRDFYIFIHVAETNSLSKTAKIMRMSVSSVSKRLSWLESYFNVILFDKTTRRVELTTEGVRFYQKILILTDNFELFFREIKTAALKLNIATYSGELEFFLADCCYQYCLSKSCDISISSLSCDLNSISIDQIFILNEKLSYPYAVHRKLPSIPRGNYINAKYVANFDFTCSDWMTDFPLVYFSLYKNEVVSYLTEGKKHDKVPRQGLHISSIEKTLSLLQKDKCIVLGAPKTYLKELIHKKIVVEVLTDWKLKPKDMYLVWKKRSSSDSVFFDFIDKIETEWINFFIKLPY